MSESRRSFVRQSAWLAGATVFGGLFMTIVHKVAKQMGEEPYGVFFAMLRIFLLLGIPTAGVQVVFAERSAAALNAESQRELASATRGATAAIFLLWCCLMAGTFLFRDAIAAQLHLTSAAVLWPTAVTALSWLLLPVFRGVLQGRQHFGALGWVAVLDGVGRFAIVAWVVLGLHAGAAAAMWGVVGGQVLSFGVAILATREVWAGAGSPVAWGQWVKRALPYSLGSAGLLVLANFDAPFLQAALPPSFRLAQLYMPASMIGFALTQVTVPLAMVMFPKIARSTAAGGRSDALMLALIGTGLIGGAAAAGAMIAPALGLRILYSSAPENLAAAPLVPWLVWALLAYALANVLVNNLMAQARFAVMPVIVLVAALYVAALWLQAPGLVKMDPMAAYHRVALTVGLANLLLLVAAMGISRRPAPAAGAA